MTVQVARCVACARGFHPLRADCTACGGVTETVAVAATGTVVSWTRIERPPAGFAAPQRVVLVVGDVGEVLFYAQAAVDTILQSGARVVLREGADGRLHAA